jgi:hypothetical protein
MNMSQTGVYIIFSFYKNSTNKLQDIR